jgi:hypothetical protein
MHSELRRFRGHFLDQDFFCRLSSARPFDGLNVSFCKNPKCANLGVAEAPYRGRLTPGAAPESGHYTLVGAGKGKPQLKCGLCGESMPMRNNQGIAEELTRMMAYLREAEDPSCLNGVCTLFTVPLSLASGQYVQRCKTAAGTQRYHCTAKDRTVTGTASAPAA